MKDKSTLIIGSGGAGCRLAYSYSQQHKTQKLLFNTAETDVENEDVILLRDENNQTFGSGRNPLFTLQNVIPKNENLIRKKLGSVIKDIDKIITFSSSGGGTGMALISFIVENILSEYNKPIYSIIILPFKSEGNPQNSNSVIMIKKFMERCSKYVTPLMLQNDVIFVEGEKNTFDLTNQSIVEFAYKIFNYEAFNGKKKNDGISTLDEREFSRILEPANGFLSINVIKIEDIEKKEVSEFYNLNTAKKMIVLFQSNRSLFLKEKIDFIHQTYPSPIKIIAESKGKEVVKFMSNGCELPSFYKDDISSVLRNIKSNKIKMKKSKNNFRKATKKLNNSLLKI